MSCSRVTNSRFSVAFTDVFMTPREVSHKWRPFRMLNIEIQAKEQYNRVQMTQVNREAMPANAGSSPGAGGFLFADRRSSLAFWLGSAVVSIGVVLHLPMFWMARHSGFILAGMPMDAA